MKSSSFLALLLGLLAASAGIFAHGGEPANETGKLLTFLDDFNRGVREADGVSVYVGLPREVKPGIKSKSEQADVITVEEQHFYSRAHPVAPELAEKLRVAMYHGARPFGGLKLCGGFHADYLIRWHTKAGAYDALLCFGCHEYKIRGPAGSVYGDLGKAEYDTLRQLLAPFREQPGEVK